MGNKVALTGAHSVIFLRDYLESICVRGRTAPGAARHALTVWSEALGIEWPMNNTLAISATNVEHIEEPKQAPPMDLATVKRLGLTALDKEVCAYNRAFAAAILVVNYASLRFAAVQKLRTVERNDGSIHGTLTTSKTKKQHGLDWPRACPRMGIAGASD